MSHTDKNAATAHGGTRDDRRGPRRGARVRRPRRRPAVRRRGDDVVRRAALDGARSPRRRRVRPPGDRRQAGAARRLCRRAGSDRRAADRVARPGTCWRPRQRRHDRCHRPAAPCRGLGVDDRLDRRRPAPACRCRPSRAVGRQRAEPGAARHDGSVVRLYHLLWELTHVCFEHPGVVEPRRRRAPCRSASPAPTRDGRPRCWRSNPTGWRASARRPAPRRSTRRSSHPVAVGDLVLVHAGTAIAVVSEWTR